MNLSSLLESILFWKGEPVSLKRLSEITNKKGDEIENALSDLEKELRGRGVTLLRNEGEVVLGTKGEASNVIESLIKEELHKDLGKAGLETLSIILYLGPVSRSEIDYIRGVNSSFIIRNLLIRGLVARSENPKDKRSFAYSATFELLSYLGITKVEELPEYGSLRKELQTRKEEKEQLDRKLEESKSE